MNSKTCNHELIFSGFCGLLWFLPSIDRRLRRLATKPLTYQLERLTWQLIVYSQLLFSGVNTLVDRRTIEYRPIYKYNYHLFGHHVCQTERLTKEWIPIADLSTWYTISFFFVCRINHNHRPRVVIHQMVIRIRTIKRASAFNFVPSTLNWEPLESSVRSFSLNMTGGISCRPQKTSISGCKRRG